MFLFLIANWRILNLKALATSLIISWTNGAWLWVNFVFAVYVLFCFFFLFRFEQQHSFTYLTIELVRKPFLAALNANLAALGCWFKVKLGVWLKKAVNKSRRILNRPIHKHYAQVHTHIISHSSGCFSFSISWCLSACVCCTWCVIVVLFFFVWFRSK